MSPRTGYAARAGRPDRFPRIRSRLGIVAVACALAMAACSGLPSSSPVQSGRSVDEKVAPEVRIVVPPPAAGASPEQIVRGFLRAGAAFQESADNGQPVGNAYLAPGSAGRWRPTSSVTVFDRATTVTVEALLGDKVRASVAVVAVVDDTGYYREVAPGTLAEVVLGLVRASGEWRLELPPDGFGLWLNTDDFGRVFGAHRVHYPVVGGRHLVPDVRWFASGPRLVTALARAQLGPVPDYLAGAVETGFPAGATLAVDAVSVDNGVATVVLTPPAIEADLPHRRAIWAQLVATLLPVPGVQGVVIDVQGAGRLSVPEATGPLRSAADVGFGPEPPPYARRAALCLSDRLTWVDIARLDAPDGLVSTPGPKGTATTSASPSGPITPSGPTTPSSPNVSTTGSVASSTAASAEDLPSVPAAYVGLAVSALGGDLAAVSEGGTELARWHEGNRVTVEPSGTALVRPSYDGQGRLWVAGRSGRASRVWTLDSRSPVDSAEPVVAEWLSARSILALAVSRDGSRVAVVSSLPDGTDRRLDVAGVVRTTSGRPTSLAKPYRQGEPLDRLSEVVWIDDTTMAALGAVRAGDPLRPWLVQLGEGIGLRRIGIADPTTNFLPVPATARFLGSAGGPRGLLVMGEPTGVLVRVGGSWRALEGASEIAVPPLG